MTGRRPVPADTAGMDADTLARKAASDTNLAGIVAGRRRAALALLVTDTTPELETREGWEALRQSGRRGQAGGRV